MGSRERKTSYCPHRQFIPEVIGVTLTGPDAEEAVFSLTPDGDNHWCQAKERIYQELGLGLGRCSKPYDNGRDCPWYTFGPATVTPQSFSQTLDHFIESHLEQEYSGSAL